MKLPFLKETKGPKIAKPMDQKAYEGGEMTEHSAWDESDVLSQVARELLMAVKDGNEKGVLDAIRAIVRHVQMEDEAQDQADMSQSEA